MLLNLLLLVSLLGMLHNPLFLLLSTLLQSTLLPKLPGVVLKLTLILMLYGERVLRDL
jgi:hypothetical protein